MGQPERRWVGTEATDETVDERGRWVVWGTGFQPPEPWRDARRGDVVAEGIVRARDLGWDAVNEADRWCVVVEGDEDDVDEVVSGDEDARGYARYLVEGKTEEMPDRPMRGTLRSDVGPRRKVDQPRPE